MSEQATVRNQSNVQGAERIIQHTIPQSLLMTELSGLFGTQYLQEAKDIINYYDVYENGADFIADGSNGDYIPSKHRYKESRKLINREARFLFSKPPDIYVTIPYSWENDDEGGSLKKAVSEQQTIIQDLVTNILEKTHFYSKLLRAARDCFIGKRVAYFVNFNEVTQRITVDFIPSLEFIYETDPDDITVMTKMVAFYIIKDSQTKSEQRIYKKKYWMEKGKCYIHEALFDGSGALIETLTEERATKFSVIPAGVILNDGLTGDIHGVSEIAELMESESLFSKLANADVDAERQNMNPTRWARDMNPATTKELSIAAGSFWDLMSDPNSPNDSVQGDVGILESGMNYVDAVNSTLSRIRSSMFEAVDMPDVSPDALKGVVSSGKTLKAIYWSLIVRCDEKMLVWRPALQNIIRLIIEGAKLYPNSAKPYTKHTIPDTEYEIGVDNQYPLPEDESDEKGMDMIEVNGQAMSRSSYMKKWRGLNDKEVEQEIRRIAFERQLLEDSYTLPPFDTTDYSGDNQSTELDGLDT